MKVDIEKVRIHLTDDVNSPSCFFMYVPLAAKEFSTREEEDAWLQYAKEYTYQKVCADERLRYGRYHVVYIPCDSQDHVAPSNYQENWCSLISHRVDQNTQLHTLMKDLEVPHQQVAFLVPNIGEFFQPEREDVVDVALIRFFGLLAALFFVLWYISVTQK